MNIVKVNKYLKVWKSTPNSEGEISWTGNKHFRVIVENNIQNSILVSFESIFYFLSSIVENTDVTVITSHCHKSARFVETDWISSIRPSVILCSIYFIVLLFFEHPSVPNFHNSIGVTTSNLVPFQRESHFVDWIQMSIQSGNT
jgi:hypothetical protein